ncbi:MAG: DUF2911 domain-containing protein [Myxococcota bacterium]
MKHLCITISLLCFGGLSQTARAQLQLPQPSPLARVMQTVGLTEMEVEYSSPAVRGRTVFGELVPYGEHWRTGANANTLISFSRPVIVAGKEIEAGTYSLHTIPGEQEWTFIINRKIDGGGSASYSMEEDVVRTQTQVEKAQFRERMTFRFAETEADKTLLTLEWAETRVQLPIVAQTEVQVDAEVQRAVSSLWQPPAMAARYFIEQEQDLERALALVDRSIEIKETWFNLWMKAKAMGGLGRTGKAKKWAKRALELGDDSSAFAFYAEQMKAALEKWDSSS